MKSWLLSVVAAALVSSIILSLCPKGRLQRLCKLACAILCILTLTAPLEKIDLLAWLSGLDVYQENADALKTDAEQKIREEQKPYIEQECEAYILEEANRMGLSAASADVELRWDEDDQSWLPDSCTVTAAYNAELSRLIAEELGIEEAKQHWSE